MEHAGPGSRHSRTPPASESADFVIVGGGVAAVTAARTLRNEGARGSILMLSEEHTYPYQRPPLTKGFMRGVLQEAQLLQIDAQQYETEGIQVQLGRRIRQVDRKRHTVIDEDGRHIGYGKLLIATGARAHRLALPGADLKGVFTLRTIADAQAIQDWLKRHPGPIVIIGTSFIAMELATSFTQMGLDVSLIDREDRVFPRIHSPGLSAYFLERCRHFGITVWLNETLQKLQGRTRVNAVATASGRKLECSTVIMATGTRPRTDFLEDSGLPIADGLLVDTFLQTPDPDIFAAGDVASYPDGQGQRQRAMHWQNARSQGHTAARNMLGQRIPYAAVLHYYCDFLDFSFTFLGTSEEADAREARGSLDEPSFAEFYLRDDRIIGLFSTNRPPEETRTIKTLIGEGNHLGPARARLGDPGDALEDLARATIVILQGGAALGAFECGVLQAMNEAGIAPHVVGGVSIGAINGAIMAGNPDRYSSAVAAFWNDVGAHAPHPVPDPVSHSLALHGTLMWGIPEFFRPRWMAPPVHDEWWPAQWTSLYELTPLKSLLEKYVDFSTLASSPIRLIISAVDVDCGEQVFFDSHIDTLTADHVLASCSLPPLFPWTTIDGRRYWDGGIISNSPLEHVLDTCGADNKQVFLVDLFPGNRPLPTNLAEVMARRDQIIYGERIRNDAGVRALTSEFKALVDEVMLAVEPDMAARLRQRPRYVRLMGRGANTTLIRIVRDGSAREPLTAAFDFSMAAIQRHRREGYQIAQRHLAQIQAGPKTD
ncbi:MAG: FAD-dependent oxidoreductase [Castellaniella sp.]